MAVKISKERRLTETIPEQPGNAVPPTDLEINFFWAFQDRPGFEIYLVSGGLIRGQVERVGRYTLRVLNPAGKRTLIYKHAISHVVPIDRE